jgi:hypothetical protein
MKTIHFLFLILNILVFCGALKTLNNSHIDKLVNKLLYILLFISVVTVYSLIFFYTYDTF